MDKSAPNKPTNLPIELTIEHEQHHSKSREDVWSRIAAFLSLKSKNTRYTYTGILKEWCEFLGTEPGSAASATRILNTSDGDALRFRKWLQSRPGENPRLEMKRSEYAREIAKREASQSSNDGTSALHSNATIRKKLAALRRIYKFLIGTGLKSDGNPFDVDKIPPPSASSGQKRPTEMIDFSAVKKVIDTPDESTPKGLRDKTVLSVLFGGGLRRSEAVGLRIGDVRRTTNGTLYLRLRATKAKRDFDQALPKWAATQVEKLIGQRLSEGAKSGDYLFVSYRGQGGKSATTRPLSTSGLYSLFTQYCRLAGASKFITPHSARATAITKLLADGIPHRQVQEFSRHSSVQMVEVYDKRRIGVEENPAKDLEFD